jgi:hypothetical protein
MVAPSLGAEANLAAPLCLLLPVCYSVVVCCSFSFGSFKNHPGKYKKPDSLGSKAVAVTLKRGTGRNAFNA